MSTTYGQKPHSWLFDDDVLTSFDWDVFTKATASEK